jgi:4-hydroxybenzoate polyprenyltransferase
VRAYLELVRPANVVTALADVLAGYAVVRGEALAALASLLLSTACLYAGGVVLNDVCDRRVDAVERPERPIPSGRVAARKAGFFAAVLLAAGVGAAAMASATGALAAAGVALLVITYDAAAKRHPVLGPITMGACRAATLLLGMAAVPALMPAHAPLMLLPLVYIAAVTAVSRGEVHGGGRPVASVALGAISAVIAALIVLGARAAFALWALPLAALLAWRVVPPFWAAYQRPNARVIRTAVRAGVLSLVVLDAAIAAAFGGLPFAVAILALGPIAAGLSRLFAVT